MPTHKERDVEVHRMLEYLDETGYLSDLKEFVRRKDGHDMYKLHLMGAPGFLGSTRTAHTYLSGACDIVSYDRAALNPRTQQ